jgi:hypothetical protein
LLAQRLGKQFGERLEGIRLPDFAVAFLHGPWAQVVAEAQLNLADGSVDPGGYLALVEDLLWSVQLRLIRRNRARLVQMVPEMLVTLRRGLALISYPPQRSETFFDALISFHEQVFDSADAAAVPETSAAPAAVEMEDSFWVAQSEAADSGYMDADDLQQVPAAAPGHAQPAGADRRLWRVDGLRIGSWVDLAVAGKWLRAQLTWASPQRTLLMFIAGTGSTHSVSRETLEQMKATGLVRIVSASRVLDNALDGVAHMALQNDLQTPPVPPVQK